MIRHLLLALALVAGVSSAAQAQAQVTTVASCSATGVSNAVGALGRFYAGPDGVLCTSGSGGGGGGTANPYPGSDYATSARQDAQTAALGAPADAAYTGSGNAGNVALGKGQYAILANLLASIGATGDTAATATGANGSQVALLKALRDKLNGTLAVTQGGTWTVVQGAAGAAAWKVDGSAVTQPVSAASLPLPAGAATAANQNATAAGTSASNAQAVQGVTNGVPLPVSASALPLPTGAATSANQSTEIAALGAPADTAYAGSGSSSIVAALKGVYNALLAPTPTGSNVIGSTTLRSAGTNRSATVTTTAANLMAANTNRQGWKLKNDCSVAIWINFDAAATAAAGSGNFQVPAGAYMASEPGFVETGAMSAIAASGTCAVTAREH